MAASPGQGPLVIYFDWNGDKGLCCLVPAVPLYIANLPRIGRDHHKAHTGKPEVPALGIASVLLRKIGPATWMRMITYLDHPAVILRLFDDRLDVIFGHGITDGRIPREALRIFLVQFLLHVTARPYHILRPDIFPLCADDHATTLEGKLR